jgi:hypothetical protein
LFEWILLLEILNKLPKKIGFGRKNQLSPQCVHTWVNGTGYTNVVVVKKGVNICEHEPK